MIVGHLHIRTWPILFSKQHVHLDFFANLLLSHPCIQSASRRGRMWMKAARVWSQKANINSKGTVPILWVPHDTQQFSFTQRVGRYQQSSAATSIWVEKKKGKSKAKLQFQPFWNNRILKKEAERCERRQGQWRGMKIEGKEEVKEKGAYARGFRFFEKVCRWLGKQPPPNFL